MIVLANHVIIHVRNVLMEKPVTHVMQTIIDHHLHYNNVLVILDTMTTDQMPNVKNVTTNVIHVPVLKLVTYVKILDQEQTVTALMENMKIQTQKNVFTVVINVQPVILQLTIVKFVLKTDQEPQPVVAQIKPSTTVQTQCVHTVQIDVLHVMNVDHV